VTLRPLKIPSVLIPKLHTENPRHCKAHSESHNRFTLYALGTEMALAIGQRQCWEDRQLLCERGDGVCCYTGRYVGTECNSDTTAVNSATEHLIVTV